MLTVKQDKCFTIGFREGTHFDAMRIASFKEARIRAGFGGGYQTYSTYSTFETKGQGEDAVWCFRCVLPSENPPPEKYCRFYQLADYLDNYKIEDITTAIKTGWNLLGVQSPAEMKFHPETKLLIAVGPSDQLEVIENVIRQLRKSDSKTPASEEAVSKKDGASAK